jgi:hypothetical protein
MQSEKRVKVRVAGFLAQQLAQDIADEGVTAA